MAKNHASNGHMLRILLLLVLYIDQSLDTNHAGKLPSAPNGHMLQTS